MTTILALQPDARQIGYAIFEEASLIDWGTKDLASIPLDDRIVVAAIPFLRTLLKWNEPDVLVLPMPTRTPSTTRNVFLEAIGGETGPVPFVVTRFSRSQIQETFRTLLAGVEVNKDLIMRALVKWFCSSG